MVERERVVKVSRLPGSRRLRPRLGDNCAPSRSPYRVPEAIRVVLQPVAQPRRADRRGQGWTEAPKVWLPARTLNEDSTPVTPDGCGARGTECGTEGTP